MWPEKLREGKEIKNRCTKLWQINQMLAAALLTVALAAALVTSLLDGRVVVGLGHC